MKLKLLVSLFSLLVTCSIVANKPYEFTYADPSPYAHASSDLKIVNHSSFSVSTDPFFCALNFLKYVFSRSSQSKSPTHKPTSTHQQSLTTDQEIQNNSISLSAAECAKVLSAYNESRCKYPHIQSEPASQSNALTTLENSRNELIEYYVAHSSPSTQDSREYKRQQALQKYLEGKDCYRSMIYPVPASVDMLLIENDCNPGLTSLLGGFQLQHALHQEFITILKDTARIRDARSSKNNDCKNITNTITRFAYAGQQHNRMGYIKHAYSFADFCYGALNILKEAYKFECELECAIGRGFKQGSKNFFTKANDPITTIRNSIESIRQLGTMVLNISDAVRDNTLTMIKNRLLQTIQDGNNIALNKTTLFDVIARDVAYLNYSKDLTILYVKKGLEVTWNNLHRANILYGAEHGTEMATEMALSHATLSAFGSLVGNGTKALETLIDAGQGSIQYLDLPITGATLEASIANEAIYAHIQERALELAHAAGVTLTEVIDKTAKLAPGIIAGGGSPHDLPQTPLDDLPHGYYPMADDIPEIHAIYHETRKGFGEEMGNRFIKIDIEHILEGEVIVKIKGGREIKKLSGCHHDFLGHLEKTKKIILKNKVFGPFGTYSAQVMGQEKIKTFFPSHWSRKEVIQNIFEAYDEFKLSSQNGIMRKDGKWRVEGVSKIGMKIEMIINQNGTICTAYPIF